MNLALFSTSNGVLHSLPLIFCLVFRFRFPSSTCGASERCCWNPKSSDGSTIDCSDRNVPLRSQTHSKKKRGNPSLDYLSSVIRSSSRSGGHGKRNPRSSKGRTNPVERLSKHLAKIQEKELPWTLMKRNIHHRHGSLTLRDYLGETFAALRNVRTRFLICLALITSNWTFPASQERV